MSAGGPAAAGKLQRGSLGVNGVDCQWSRWEASDIDGRTREGEPFGRKANQATT
jgi:hypothetical protein